MRTDFDMEFKQIESLTWHPYVGSDFENNRILIVGESHYLKQIEINSFEKHLDPLFTRHIVQDMCFDRDYYKIKIFTNFHRAMMGNDTFDTYPFWNQYAFYNFIQRPMEEESGERPTHEDIDHAWHTFFELIQVLNPSRVLFLGNSSADRFNLNAEQMNRAYKPVQWIKKIGSAYGKRAFLTNNNQEIQLDFIRHPSKYFSWERWREYLLEYGFAR